MEATTLTPEGRRRITNQDEINEIFEEEISSNKHNRFSNIQFECEANFEDRKLFSTTSSFDNSIFLKRAIFTGVVFNVKTSFNDTTFKEDVIFDDAKFREKVTFYSTKFEKKATFQNTSFEKLADFWSAEFFKKLIFYKTDFNKKIVFSQTTFNDNVLFTYSSLGNNTIFRHAIFKKGFDLSLVANIKGGINLFDIQHDFKKYETIPNQDIKEYDYEYMVSEVGEIPIENKRETYRIFKDKLIKQNNKIEALDYRKYEMKTYTRELWQQVKYGLTEKDIKKFLKIPAGNLAINFFNKISNNYGSNWILGTGFTLGVGLFFFLFMLTCLNN